LAYVQRVVETLCWAAVFRELRAASARKQARRFALAIDRWQANSAREQHCRAMRHAPDDLVGSKTSMHLEPRRPY
jgi:hypothetical protein